jgi:hypothetical protein
MLIALLLSLACTPASDDSGVGPSPVITGLATQNAGTTTYLDLVADSPSEEVREVCSSWYDNNLCLSVTEDLVTAAVATELPDLLFLQEVWDQRSCDDDDRPGDANEAPYACSLGSEAQPGRLLPGDWWWGCAQGYPDNCIAFPPSLATPVGCTGQDCSVLVEDLDAACGSPGRIASWELETAAGPLLAVVVHTNAGAFEDDLACRAQQLEALQARLEALPAETSIAVAGDFNLDPALYEGADAEAFEVLVSATGLTRLGGYEQSHRISHVMLDHVLVRGAVVDVAASCEARYLDEGESDVMLDHAWVGCR